jgi:hypothetical protein
LVVPFLVILVTFEKGSVETAATLPAFDNGLRERCASLGFVQHALCMLETFGR